MKFMAETQYPLGNQMLNGIIATGANGTSSTVSEWTHMHCSRWFVHARGTGSICRQQAVSDLPVDGIDCNAL